MPGMAGRDAPSAGFGRILVTEGEEELMAASIASLALALSVASTGGIFHNKGGGFIMPPGPGYGWGFPNGAPDGYGYVDYGPYLPLGADRTPEYHFPRNFALPPLQLVPSTYYNPYVTRGQRYIAYVGCGGAHPAGGPPMASAETPFSPNGVPPSGVPVVPPPRYSGRTEAPAVPSGGTGLIP